MKTKNMIYLTISYIPWVVYWIISANLLPYGGVIALVLELILIGMERSNQNYSFMDLFSIAYFIITILANYIVKTDMFIVGDGYLGYGWLFIMSIISILRKRPFMSYYIKKDFEEGDISKTIFQTKIWCSVFFIDIWIFAFIHVPIKAVIYSNIFVLIGIVLSIFNENA
ncbi:hypothetical protein KQI30_08960 [Clostridium bornimense]|uniref:hypothetical protein n=1 Tax=Clostridium bornimense TaxID=1216932 RepID=UPI001C10E78A|nr:hypothetical protein [Clostridium bornimense]MBU5316399.1 hypothetical protein [Clostridium bornimense]